MSFDAMVSSPGRLRILTALASEPHQPFVQLRARTGLTDGNLATHARRLAAAGFVAIEKSIEGSKVTTTLHLTTAGREALAGHAHALLAALESRPTVASPADPPPPVESPAHGGADDWVD